MRVEIEQWSTTQESNNTDVVVSVYTKVNDLVENKVQYRFTIEGRFDNITEEFKQKVEAVIASL